MSVISQRRGNRVAAFANKTRVLLATWFAHMTAYRAEIVIWTIGGCVPLIMMAVWIGQAQARGGRIDGYTPAGFASYFLAAWITQQMLVSWAVWELDRLIRMGELSPKLLRPLDPMWEQLAAHVAEKAVRVPLILIIAVAGMLLVPGARVTPDIAHVLVYILSVVLAFAIRFLIAYSLGLLAFWISQATALDELYYVVFTFAGGGFAPLTLYPAVAQAIVAWTPFPYLVYYPVRVLTGASDSAEVLHVLLVQCLWLAAAWGLRSVLWRTGLRRYGAVGA